MVFYHTIQLSMQYYNPLSTIFSKDGPISPALILALISAISRASFLCLRFSISVLYVYKKGLRAEFSGRTKIAMATFTSLEMAVPEKAIKPNKPIGNQQRKSDTTTVIKRLAMVKL